MLLLSFFFIVCSSSSCLLLLLRLFSLLCVLLFICSVCFCAVWDPSLIRWRLPVMTSRMRCLNWSSPPQAKRSSTTGAPLLHEQSFLTNIKQAAPNCSLGHVCSKSAAQPPADAALAIHYGVDYIWEAGTLLLLLLLLCYRSKLGIFLESLEILMHLPAVYGALISSKCGFGVACGALQ